MTKHAHAIDEEAPLAVSGGTPHFTLPLRAYNAIGDAEVRAVAEVARTGVLSAFYGSWSEQFRGGPKIREFERLWAERFNVKHALTVNSNTSGLIAAMGAVGVEPGDEVIVPPYSMSATVMAPLVYGGIPVFVDIEPTTFCLDPAKVRAAITPRTRAILAVNIFGHPAALAELRALADEHGIRLVEDNAQGPLASENGRYAGTVGHIGVFSLNCHKHIHTGEGGVCVTDDDHLAHRLQAIRNHGENVVEQLGIENISGIVGFNFRMTELSAAVGIEQLKRIDELVESRQRIAERLTEGVADLEGLVPPAVRPGCRHVYYVWGMLYDAAVMGVSRAAFSRALAAEGFPHEEGYVQPLYLLPVFQKRIAFGKHPFNLTDRTYPPGLCPTCERLEAADLFIFAPCAYDLSMEEVDRLAGCIRKVHAQRHKLETA